ncbi:MAG: YbhB/YbcL family Raf kinase inhibitor-like protein [Candidatus Bathyarchaeota archaeon]|nr:YbhB/YbcL family Raf kinase inhibitor-like protein [Candidatus Bathyarchaeota archaeon]
MQQLTITSSAFEHNKRIPEKYTCTGQGINPPLSIEDIPQDTKTLAIIMVDPDAVEGTFNHWVTWNIPPSKNKISEHSVPGTEGLNTAEEHGYHPPCPPRGKPHRYIFKVYALDTELNLDVNTTAEELEAAMQGHILAKGELIGLYQR